MSRPTKAPRRRHSLEELLGAALMAAMVGILTIQVASRFLLSDSLSWSEELARYMFIWLVFLTLGAVVLRGEHIVIDVVVTRLPAAARRWVAQLGYVLMLAINVVVLVKGFELAYVIGDLGQHSPALGLPMWVVYAALPVGLTLASVRTVQTSILLWTRPPADQPVLDGSEAEVTR